MTMGGSSISQPDPDQGLVERAKQGDAEAFAGLVEQYQRLLTSLAMGILHDEVRAEDVVQDSFVSAWKSLSGFRGEARFRNWLCRILVNKAHSDLRWGGLRRWLRLDSPSDEQQALVDCLKDTGADADPESGALHSEQSRKIRKTVASLPVAKTETWNARITSVEGPVVFFANGERDGVEAAAGLPLLEGDHIETGPGGRAELALAADSTILLGPSAVFTIRSLDEDDSILELPLGYMVAKLKLRFGGKSRSLRVRTPTAVAAVRGTEFAVRVEEDGETDVGVFDEGRVAVMPAGQGDNAEIQETIIKEHQEVTFLPRPQEDAEEDRPAPQVRDLDRLEEHQSQVEQMRERQQELRKDWQSMKPEERQEMRQEIRERHEERLQSMPEEKRQQVKQQLQRRHAGLSGGMRPGGQGGQGGRKRPE